MKKLKRIRSIAILSLVCLFINSFGIFSVSAHENATWWFWNDIYYSNSMQKHVVRLRYNMDTMTNSVYIRKLRDALNDWQWEDNGYVDPVSTTLASARLWFYDQYPESFNQSDFAVTRAYLVLSTLYIYSGPYGTGTPRSSNQCYKITRAPTYVNIKRQSTYTYNGITGFNEGDIAHTWVHEIGHSIGMDETNDGTQSVMRQGRGQDFGWANYWMPQQHDKNDVGRYHGASWS